MERGKAQTRMVPDLKDIRTYLMLDMMPVITGGVQEALDSGRLAEIMQSPLISETVHPAMVKIKKVSCYLEDRNDFYADVQAMLTLHAQDESGSTYVEYGHVVISLFLTFIEEERTCCVEEITSLAEAPDRTGYLKLDQWLAPMMTWDRKEKCADKIWEIYFRDAIRDPHRRDPVELARRMKLKIRERYMRDVDRRAVLELANVGCSEDQPTEDAIVINTCATDNPTGRDLQIYMCCMEYEWHYLFYNFQGLNYDLLQNVPKKEVPIDARDEGNPLGFLDDQKDHVARALMMPKGFLEKYIAAHRALAGRKERCHGYDMHEAARLEEIGLMLNRDYNYSLSQIRIRFRHLGNWQAKNIFNWIGAGCAQAYSCDKKYIEDSTKHYVIGPRENAIMLYCCDERFRSYVSDGSFVYANGLLVAAAEGNLIHDPTLGLMPSRRVNSSVDQYCLRIQRTYIARKHAYKYAFDPAYLVPGAMPTMPRIDVSEEAEWMKGFADFHTLLGEMIRKKTSVPKLVKASKIPASKIAQLCAHEEEKYDLRTIVQICIGLHLPPALSGIMLERARIKIEDDPLSGRLQAMLSLFYLEDMQFLMDPTMSTVPIYAILSHDTAA